MTINVNNLYESKNPFNSHINVCSNVVQIPNGCSGRVATSPEDAWGGFSTSPNSSFLNGCQSPTFLSEPMNFSFNANNHNVVNSSNINNSLMHATSQEKREMVPELSPIPRENLFDFANDIMKESKNNASNTINSTLSSANNCTSNWQNFSDESLNSGLQSGNSCGITQNFWNGSLDKGDGNKLICS